MRENDIVEDMFYRVKEILGDGFEGEIVLKLEKAEQSIRQDWGGTEPYIAKRRISNTKKQKIIDDLRKGVPVKKVVNDSGVSVTYAYNLLRAGLNKIHDSPKNSIV